MKKVFALSGFFLLLSCAVAYTETMEPVLRDLTYGHSAEAITRLQEVFPDSTGRDRLLYLMELGNLARYGAVLNSI